MLFIVKNKLLLQILIKSQSTQEHILQLLFQNHFIEDERLHIDHLFVNSVSRKKIIVEEEKLVKVTSKKQSGHQENMIKDYCCMTVPQYLRLIDTT